MSVVILGSRDTKEPYDVKSYWGAVLPNRKVLTNDAGSSNKEAVENTIKVRSEVYTKQTGEEHMPTKELFSEIQSSWTTMSSSAEEMDDSEAKKIMKEAGIS
jgi:hypothetical protein